MTLCEEKPNLRGSLASLTSFSVLKRSLTMIAGYVFVPRNHTVHGCNTKSLAAVNVVFVIT